MHACIQHMHTYHKSKNKKRSEFPLNAQQCLQLYEHLCSNQCKLTTLTTYRNDSNSFVHCTDMVQCSTWVNYQALLVHDLKTSGDHDVYWIASPNQFLWHNLH